jgi:hypothetical protein
MALLTVLTCGLVRVLFSGLVVNFLFFNNHSAVTTLGLDLISGAYMNKLTVAVVPSD